MSGSEPTSGGSERLSPATSSGSDGPAVRTVRIVNRQGLHARPVMQFVDLASQFQSAIKVRKEDLVVDGKSPMEMMLLAATCGTELTIEARGPDQEQAVEALCALVARRFDEPDSPPEPTGNGGG